MSDQSNVRTPKDPRPCRSILQVLAERAKLIWQDYEARSRQPWEGKHKP